MKDKQKQKSIVLITTTAVTVLLGIIAVATAVKIQQLSTSPIAPNVPSSQPLAQSLSDPATACISSFAVATSICGGWCDEDSDCGNGLVCEIDSNLCRNPLCLEDATCSCTADGSLSSTKEATASTTVASTRPSPSPLARVSPTPFSGVGGVTASPTPLARPTPRASASPVAVRTTPSPIVAQNASTALPEAGITLPTIALITVGAVLLLLGLLSLVIL